METRELGAFGEHLAWTHLEEKGYRLVEKNYRTEFGEVDLICLDPEDEIVFVEVKTRESLESGYPEDSVHPGKLKHLENAADCFLQDRHLDRRPYRFDVVAIII
ncbi:MAG: YraN family protein, partial [Patescibacteria group bacterium]